MNILFVCALPIELKKVKASLLGYSQAGVSFSFLLSGVGSYQTIYTLQNYLSSHRVDFIVNIGVCGVSNGTSPLPKVIQVYRIKNLASKRESLVPNYFTFADLISIASSEKVITGESDLEGENYVDMESYGIDFVATKEKIPFIILKIPFDRVGRGSREVDLSLLEESFEHIDYQRFIASILDFFEKNPQEKETDFSVYFSHYSFTFSEKEIFKKAYQKYRVLHGDPNIFFQNNKHLTKKDFLKLFTK